jgi:hypothetical protein
MKLFGRGVLFLAVICLLNACASKSEVVTEGSQNRAPVAGESRSGTDVTPGAGPGGASANVRW